MMSFGSLRIGDEFLQCNVPSLGGKWRRMRKVSGGYAKDVTSGEVVAMLSHEEVAL